MKTWEEYIESVDPEVMKRILLRLRPGESKLIQGILVKRTLPNNDLRFNQEDGYIIDGEQQMGLERAIERISQL